MKMTGAKALIKALEDQGVGTIFGYPGGTVLPIYDALYDSKIRHVLVRHEQAAAHAADAFARVSGEVGVCLATSGPGATNLVTGIATAYIDSSPMVVITGQVPTTMIGTDAFQEADITGITLPIVKHSYLLQDADEIPMVIKEAFHIAAKGRPGPVLIDIPVDVSKAEMSYKEPNRLNLPGFKPTIKGHAGQIRGAAKIIINSKRPVIYAGGGIVRSEASAELKKLAVKWNIPVATTLMALGTFPQDHKLSLGFLGMHGTKTANNAMSKADLILAIGARFSDRVTGPFESFGPNARILHIDIDPAEIGKNVKPEIPIVGDVKTVLTALLEAMTARKKPKPLRKVWMNQIEKWKKQFPMTYKKNGAVKPQFVIQKISQATKGNAIITTDVGQCQMWAAQYYKYCKPKSMITSGGLGTMGYGLPAAIGAQVASPKSVVWQIAGDGSFQMTCQELAVAAYENLPIKIAIINNGYLGMVRQWQELFYSKRYSSSNLNREQVPDFLKLAAAYGIDAVRVKKSSEVAPAIKKAMQKKGPFLIDFFVEPEECVFPMAQPGRPTNEMMGV